MKKQNPCWDFEKKKKEKGFHTKNLLPLSSTEKWNFGVKNNDGEKD